MVKKVKKDANKRRQRNLKSESCIMGITALCLLLAACGTSSGRAEENPDVWEASDDGVDSYMGKLSEEGGIGAEPQSIETKEEPKYGRRSMKAVRCRSLADICTNIRL